MWCAIAVNTWRGMPFFAITLLAGLQTINPDLHERPPSTAPTAGSLLARDVAAPEAGHARWWGVLDHSSRFSTSSSSTC